MYDRLHHFYQHALALDNTPAPDKLTLHFQNDRPRQLVLDKSKLSQAEIALLNTLFHTNVAVHHQVTQENEWLYEWLINGHSPPKHKLERLTPPPLRCIHFSIKGEINETDAFIEAIKNVFPSVTNLLWKSRTEGVLLQHLPEDTVEEELSVESIIDTLATDFLIQTSFFIGSPIDSPHLLYERFKWETTLYDAVKMTFRKKSFFYEQEIVTYYLLHHIPESTLKLVSTMLDSVMNDRELMHSIKTYLECNMNTSLAAKKMYIHRNTLQYRVDKFIEKTAIDIKQFANAAAVYLLILRLEAK
ncbi:PucR family transcriptional regulator [Salipaludibacillus agaradhaerens]|uniref:PucR family transcriptional regulator n=1 Tax=Salipaludibacillus agaradhaerens TaxID=76935 RepID=UPI0009983157|nr:helix-turn-helix domain-containing protein [Salipaludibacillus agaradhaerens]